MRYKLAVVIVAGLALCSAVPGSAQVCDCPQLRPVADELAASAAVFSGRVLAIDVVGTGDLALRVQFERYDCWKGAPGPQVQVYTARTGCGYRFQLGVQYLVYAALEPPNVLLTTHQCTRTQFLVGAGADLAALGTPVCTVAVTPSTWGAVKRLY